MDVETVDDSSCMVVVAKRNHSYPHGIWSTWLLPDDSRGTAFSVLLSSQPRVGRSTAEQAGGFPLTHLTFREKIHALHETNE